MFTLLNLQDRMKLLLQNHFAVFHYWASLSESHVGIKLMFDKIFVIKSCTLQDELHAV